MELFNELRATVDPAMLLSQFGYLGLFFIVFAESGLFFGFFLPGDSLLLVTGILAATGFLNIWVAIPLIFSAAILGDQVGYWTGHKFGRRLFRREDSWFFHQDHVRRSEAFFARHGKKTIVLARFIPIVRTFAPILAGVGDMAYGTFVLYNVTGAVLWGIGVTMAGYFLGNIASIENYFTLLIAVVIAISVLPIVKEFFGRLKER